jgi:hypothetical protein
MKIRVSHLRKLIKEAVQEAMGASELIDADEMQVKDLVARVGGLDKFFPDSHGYGTEDTTLWTLDGEPAFEITRSGPMGDVSYKINPNL